MTTELDPDWLICRNEIIHIASFYRNAEKYAPRDGRVIYSVQNAWSRADYQQIVNTRFIGTKLTFWRACRQLCLYYHMYHKRLQNYTGANELRVMAQNMRQRLKLEIW